MDDESIDAAVVAMMKTLVRKGLTTDMLRLVDDLREAYSPGFDMFPIRAGEMFMHIMC